jgi:hypothetical protein
MKQNKLVTLLVAALSGLAVSASANAVPAQNLSYWSYSQVYGWINFNNSSPYLPSGGSSSFQVQLPSDYQSGNSVASSSWNLPAGESTPDFFYNTATNGGQYGYGFSGQAQVFGNQLKASMVTTTTDTNWENPNSTNLYAYSYASFNDQWLIKANKSHTAGSYGAILVTATLDGYFPAASGGNGSAYLQAQNSFTDTAGVNYNSSFQLNANPTGSSSSGSAWTSEDWTVQGNSITATKKLLFQYGTVFNLNMYLQAYSSFNGEANFFNTGKITDILLPFEAELETGSQQSGLEGVSLGTVRNSLSLNDPNTNWNFGSQDGGAIIPSVPEPESYAMFLAGLGLIGFMAKRRLRA